MNRIPPAVSYLTIYNQTLRPSQPVDKADEDAEEQAHILFYTSRERAVSRDRMLRQIGLAKALINFSQSFGAEQPCNTVHSQTRRMIMVSPEPDFWIHACVELAKVERVSDSKVKSKAKRKPSPDKGKLKEPAPIYDHEDSSVIDGALKTHILNGFEKFKLTHGSMSSILAALGQQALELQLERFWTVWAWSWDLEEKAEFAEDCGMHLHPDFAALISILDDFSVDLSDHASPVILSRSTIIPSARYTEHRYPASLATHLSSMIPPRAVPSSSSDTVNALGASVDTIRGRPAADYTFSGTSGRAKSPEGNGKFLGIPTNVDFNMDPTKWQWPGYLTFGKKNMPKPPIPEHVVTPPVEGSEDTIVSKEADSSNVEDSGKTDAHAEESMAASPIKSLEVTQVEAEVNAEDLQDAIESDSMSLGSKGTGSLKHDVSSLGFTGQQVASSSRSTTASEDGKSLPQTPPLPEFSMTKVYLAPFNDPTATKRVSIHYFVMNDLMFALPISQASEGSQESENTDLQYAHENVVALLSDIEWTARDEALKSVSESLPSANKILQPQDRYLMTTSQYTLSSPGFSSKSGHLFSAKAILDTDPGISEVFSRGQNPQHWHVARRGLGGINPSLGLNGTGDEVFMEVHRKETSLTDVDNVLTGVVKKSGLVEVGGLR